MQTLPGKEPLIASKFVHVFKKNGLPYNALYFEGFEYISDMYDTGL